MTFLDTVLILEQRKTSGFELYSSPKGMYPSSPSLVLYMYQHRQPVFATSIYVRPRISAQAGWKSICPYDDGEDHGARHEPAPSCYEHKYGLARIRRVRDRERKPAVDELQHPERDAQRLPPIRKHVAPVGKKCLDNALATEECTPSQDGTHANWLP
jgi:hypothetical protein